MQRQFFNNAGLQSVSPQSYRYGLQGAYGQQQRPVHNHLQMQNPSLQDQFLTENASVRNQFYMQNLSMQNQFHIQNPQIQNPQMYFLPQVQPSAQMQQYTFQMQQDCQMLPQYQMPQQYQLQQHQLQQQYQWQRQHEWQNQDYMPHLQAQHTQVYPQPAVQQAEIQSSPPQWEGSTADTAIDLDKIEVPIKEQVPAPAPAYPSPPAPQKPERSWYSDNFAELDVLGRKKLDKDGKPKRRSIESMAYRGRVSAPRAEPKVAHKTIEGKSSLKRSSAETECDKEPAPKKKQKRGGAEKQQSPSPVPAAVTEASHEEFLDDELLIDEEGESPYTEDLEIIEAESPVSTPASLPSSPRSRVFSSSPKSVKKEKIASDELEVVESPKTISKTSLISANWREQFLDGLNIDKSPLSTAEASEDSNPTSEPPVKPEVSIDQSPVNGNDILFSDLEVDESTSLSNTDDDFFGDLEIDQHPQLEASIDQYHINNDDDDNLFGDFGINEPVESDEDYNARMAKELEAEMNDEEEEEEYVALRPRSPSISSDEDEDENYIGNLKYRFR